MASSLPLESKVLIQMPLSFEPARRARVISPGGSVKMPGRPRVPRYTPPLTSWLKSTSYVPVPSLWTAVTLRPRTSEPSVSTTAQSSLTQHL